MERKEPTLTSAPVLDEVVDAGKPEARAPQPHSQKVRARSEVREPRESSSSGSSVVVIALLLAVAALGGSGFLAWQLQQSQQGQVAAEVRIQQLEQRLELSDDESSQSVTAMRAKLKWADSEIRKLWGVSFDTNRKGIAANKSELSGAKTKAAAAAKAASSAKQVAEANKTQLAKLQQQVTALAPLAAEFTQLRQGLQSAVDQLNTLDQQLDELSGRVAMNEEAVEAIDAYRRTINREVLQLKQRLNKTPAP